MTEVVATRKFQFRLTSKGNVSELAKEINSNLFKLLNKNICEASASIDPVNPSTIVVEMKCGTGTDIYSLDKDIILRIIKESERDKIDHIIGPLELQV
nr:hypothetical protein [Candidatus Njordarchaeota archaeon]